MMGSGLYHFKVRVLDGYSYCKLETQFMFYVTNTPIVHHLDMLILFSVAVLFGGGLFILYLKYLSLPNRTHDRVAERKRFQNMLAKKESE
ncbi:cation channel sperm-associated auxiliary subunit beta-like [Lineus longissimus]|uniref:cation channel sperm-associated auxiliary subunit beta-like n=1 Tax=Lineus longissimus TaxID=88925 RepID=UPI00315D99ED